MTTGHLATSDEDDDSSALMVRVNRLHAENADLRAQLTSSQSREAKALEELKDAGDAFERIRSIAEAKSPQPAEYWVQLLRNRRDAAEADRDQLQAQVVALTKAAQDVLDAIQDDKRGFVMASIAGRLLALLPFKAPAAPVNLDANPAVGTGFYRTATPGTFGPSEWLDLLMACQDGRATCMRVMEIIEREFALQTPSHEDMANAFLRWPLPKSVCADLCATKQGLGRVGTNLLSYTEALEMFRAIIPAAPAAPDSAKDGQ